MQKVLEKGGMVRKVLITKSSFQTLATLATWTTVSCEKLTIIRRELTRLLK